MTCSSSITSVSSSSGYTRIRLNDDSGVSVPGVAVQSSEAVIRMAAVCVLNNFSIVSLL